MGFCAKKTLSRPRCQVFFGELEVKQLERSGKHFHLTEVGREVKRNKVTIN